MKLVISAAAAALALAVAAPAFAQDTTTTPAAAPAAPASTCPPMAEAPTLPDGNTAKGAEMQKGQDAYTEWVTEAQTHLSCKKAEVDALRAQIEQIKAQADVKVGEYNASVEKINEVGEFWKTSGEAYIARFPQKKKK